LIEQARHDGTFVLLAGRERQTDEVPLPIGAQVYFGAKSALTAA